MAWLQEPREPCGVSRGRREPARVRSAKTYKATYQPAYVAREAAARSGLKPGVVQPAAQPVFGRNGRGSPLGFETQKFALFRLARCRREGAARLFGFETELS